MAAARRARIPRAGHSRRSGIRCSVVPVMSRRPKRASRASSAAATHGVRAAASGPPVPYPTKPPALRITAAPSDGCGVPLAISSRPHRPSSRAAQPIAARRVAWLRSGWRRNRQASNATSTGARKASDPIPPVTASWMPCPAALSIRTHRPPASTMATPRVSRPSAVPAVMRFHVARAAADRPGHPPDGAGQRHPGALQHPADPPDQDHHRVMGARWLAGLVTGPVAGFAAGFPRGLGRGRGVAAAGIAR